MFPLVFIGGAVLLLLLQKRGTTNPSTPPPSSPSSDCLHWENALQSSPTAMHQEIIDRATQIRLDFCQGKRQMGDLVYETLSDGRTYRFHIECHGASAQVSFTHAGVGVCVCVPAPTGADACAMTPMNAWDCPCA